MPGAGLSDGCSGKALSEMPAFQPYWGKPAVRNDRGDSGNVGIIRSPIRATVLPDCGGRSAMVVPTATLDLVLSVSAQIARAGGCCTGVATGAAAVHFCTVLRNSSW
jgi:hypothetical protein